MDKVFKFLAPTFAIITHKSPVIQLFIYWISNNMFQIFQSVITSPIKMKKLL